jgi:NAD(P)-dependent dehydrogenase (short-subunit alcohol dehydrogenase family)
MSTSESKGLPPRGINVPGQPVDTQGVFSPGRVAVIIGSASGIGLCAAKRFATIGMKVVLGDIDESDLKDAHAACAALAPTGDAAIFSRRVDCADFEDVKRLKEAVYEHFGEVHFLMNNAAIQNNGRANPLAERGFWERTMNVNMWGVINGCQAFVPSMQAQGNVCVVVNTGSKQGLTFPPGDTAYNLSKAAVNQYTAALQHHLRSQADNKVNAFLLVPGWTITMISARAQRRINGDAHDPSKEECERSYRGNTDPTAAQAALEARGAWPASKVVDLMVDSVTAGAPFYIICPDHETSTELDNARMQWQSDDVVFRRVPLSRWSAQYGDEFRTVANGL